MLNKHQNNEQRPIKSTHILLQYAAIKKDYYNTFVVFQIKVINTIIHPGTNQNHNQATNSSKCHNWIYFNPTINGKITTHPEKTATHISTTRRSEIIYIFVVQKP